MKKQKNKNLKKTTDMTLTVCTLFWICFCMVGAVLYSVFSIKFNLFFVQIPDTLIKYNFPHALTNKDFWIFLVSSVRYEVCFLLFLTFLSRTSSHVILFAIRGMLFGIGGMSILQKTDFSYFLLVVVRQVLFTALFLCFAAFLCSERNPKQKAFLGIVLLCELGMSLLIQFLFLFVLSKI